MATKHETAMLQLLICLALGCQGSPSSRSPVDDGGDIVADETTADATTASSTDTMTSSISTTSTGSVTSTSEVDTATEHDSETGRPRFDLGGLPDFGPPSAACKKVDLLFVVDNSGSMANEQSNLTASFPEFVAGMRSELEDTESYRVGVVTTDAYAYNGSPCSRELGAFVTATGGQQSSNQPCGPYAEHPSYMTDADDLESKFACAAQVGISGDGGERPARALLRALSPQLQAPGACNDGFLREDALLVVVIITDEDDVRSPGDPTTWARDLIAAKGGEESRIVLLSLLHHDLPNQCSKSRAPAKRLIDLTDTFSYGFVGDICAPQYAGYFKRAVEVVDTACDNFIPPQ